MKFNAYIVRLEHRENSLTGSLLVDGVTVSANFKKIAPDIFLAQFKSQMAFTFRQKLELKSREKQLTVLMPELSKYNKRKLTKLSKFLEHLDPFDGEGDERFYILSHLTTIDKFTQTVDLLDFFSLDHPAVLAFLLDKELKQEIKLIDLTYLTVTSYDHYRSCLEQFNAILTESYTSRSQSLKFSDIEAKTKLPQSGIFFKYLLRSLSGSFSFNIRKDRIMFRKVALSTNEKASLGEISEILKKNKMAVFSIDEVLKLSGLSYKVVNDSIWYMVDGGEVVQLNQRYYILESEMAKILNRLKKYKRNQGEMIDIKDFRELTLYTRKYIIAIFEYLDSQHITQRVENQRKILLGA